MDNEIYGVFFETLVIPIVYIICYLLFAKEKTLKTAGSALMNSFVLYLAGTIPFIMIKSIFKDFWELTRETQIMGVLLSVIFSIPFFAGLVKSVRNDFKIYNFKKIEVSATLIIKYISLITAIGFVEFMCFFAFFSGEASLEILLFGLCFLFALLLVIKRAFSELAQIEIKISDKFIAYGTLITIILLFGVVILG